MTALRAFQETLAGEHAALYLYGLLGGQTSASAQPDFYAALQSGYDAHRAQRDQLMATVRDLGGRPRAASVSYEPPGPIGTPAEIAETLREVERRCAATYAWLVSRTAGDQRRWAVTALGAGALRLQTLGEPPEPFPGLDEL